MEKGLHQKLKLLYLAKILLTETDENHHLSLSRITELLAGYEIKADRKTLYNDFEELRYFGIDVIGEPDGGQYRYYVAGRDFELPELKLLVDSVQSSKFITERKSRELIKKLESLVSRHEAKALQRQVHTAGRIKNMNESIYYDVDKIHSAIAENHQIRFQYFQWTVKKEPQLRHDGAYYQVSPWALVWDDENYYLIGFDQKDQKIKHFRVDKMRRLTPTDLVREGQKDFQESDLPNYSQQLFGMFGGEVTSVTLLCENHLAGVFIDRFGRDIPLLAEDEEHFRVRIEVAVSEQFLGWVLGLGSGVRIISPEAVVSRMQEKIRKLTEVYL